MLHLMDVNGDNWRLELSVAESQKEYVLDSTGILARAYAYRNEGSKAFFICDGDTPVGMGLYCDYPELESYELNQFFIDQRYQGRGYGREAMQLILDEMRRAGKYRSAVLWYMEENEAAKRLYECIGFSQMGCIQDEIGMKIEL